MSRRHHKTLTNFRFFEPNLEFLTLLDKKATIFYRNAAQKIQSVTVLSNNKNDDNNFDFGGWNLII